MRTWARILLSLVLGGAALALTASAQASGGTSQAVSMTFAEPTHPSVSCPGFPDVSCGSGQVIPYGQATEIVVFDAGCGGNCDLRTITLPSGSLILNESVTSATCPQVCRPGPLEVASGTLADIVAGGTGMFAGASGALSGTLGAAISNARPAGSATVQLSGTITYGS